MMIQSMLNLRMTVKNEVKHRMQKAFITGEAMTVTHQDRDYHGRIAALHVYGEMDGLSDVTVSVSTVTDTDPPLIHPDRSYGRSPIESLKDLLRVNLDKPDLVYHISEMKDLRLPTIGRRVREAALAHWESYARYEVGEMYFDGDIEFTVEMTGRNGYAPRVGALAQVNIGSTVWTGFVTGCNPIYYGNRPPELRITLRPTGVPVFTTQPVLKESTMKVFETLVVNVNEQNVVTGIAQGIKLVVAADSQAAKDATLVDYATENKISGKDLAGFKVRTREFCA